MDQAHNNSYSNLLVGISSTTASLPIDVLVIGDAHGGGKASFREQAALTTEVESFAGFYIEGPIRTFHQQQMRKLFSQLDARGLSWVFTDLIKCYVWEGRKGQRAKGAENRRVAIQHCRQYLIEQVKLLRPGVVLLLGKKVSGELLGSKSNFKHAKSATLELGSHRCEALLSYFPSGVAADHWARCDGWDPILSALSPAQGA